MQNFVCPRCARDEEGDDGTGDDEGPRLVINGDVLEEVELQFCYLGDVLDCIAGVERAVRAWRRRWEIASLLVNRGIGLRIMGRVYEA